MHSVYFDLDGTLTDSRDGIARCLRYALEQLGVAPPPLPRLAQTIGIPLRTVFAQLLQPPDPAAIRRAVRLYRRRFETTGMFENSVYPGVVPLLRRIRDRGWRACVVTGKPEPYAIRILDHFRLRPFFAAVYGSRMNGALTDKSALIRHALQQESARPADVVMVGDRSHDILGARANHVAAVGVTYGYGDPLELQRAGPACLCHAPGEILQALEHCFQRPPRNPG